jgi:hypothetical protein
MGIINWNFEKFEIPVSKKLKLNISDLDPSSHSLDLARLRWLSCRNIRLNQHKKNVDQISLLDTDAKPIFRSLRRLCDSVLK